MGHFEQLFLRLTIGGELNWFLVWTGGGGKAVVFNCVECGRLGVNQSISDNLW